MVSLENPQAFARLGIAGQQPVMLRRHVIGPDGTDRIHQRLARLDLGHVHCKTIVLDMDRIGAGFGAEVFDRSGESFGKYVTSEVRGGTLLLGFQEEGLDSYSPTSLKFTLTVEELSGLAVSGSGDIATDSLETTDLDIRISGSGEVQIGSLTADSLDVQINGSGEVDLAGDATTQSMGVSGSGELRAGDLKGEDVEVDISGSGAATVWATESLDVSVTGSGSVGYYGNPTIDVSSSGSGGAKSLGDK